MTSAHEIGHEILLAFGGQIYSKGHEGTTTGINLLFQKLMRMLPTFRMVKLI